MTPKLLTSEEIAELWEKLQDCPQSMLAIVMNLIHTLAHTEARARKYYRWTSERVDQPFDNVLAQVRREWGMV